MVSSPPPAITPEELAQYSELRAESLAAKGFQQSILQWCLGAVAAFGVAGATLFTADSSTLALRSANYYAAFVVLGLVTPLLVGCAFGVWLGEVSRMERVGRYLRTQEVARALDAKLSLSAYAGKRRLAVSWESTIYDDLHGKAYGKNNIGSTAAVLLFASLFYLPIASGLAIASLAAIEGLGNSGVYLCLMVAAVSLGLLFPAVFIPLLGALRRTSHGRVPSRHHVSLRTSQSVDVVLPCLNESEAIPWVLARIPVRARALVVDNGSTDSSVKDASSFTKVLSAPHRGVGLASTVGILAGKGEIVCILDLDATVDPAELAELIRPIVEDKADYVIGTRQFQKGSHGLAHSLAIWVRRKWLKKRFPSLELSDIGSARAFRRSIVTPEILSRLDKHAGWSLDLTLSILRGQGGTRVAEVPMKHYPRMGRSKITGTVRGFIGAARSSAEVIRKHSKP